jgi:hypothetical protein
VCKAILWKTLFFLSQNYLYVPEEQEIEKSALVEESVLFKSPAVFVCAVAALLQSCIAERFGV